MQESLNDLEAEKNDLHNQLAEKDSQLTNLRAQLNQKDNLLKNYKETKNDLIFQNKGKKFVFKIFKSFIVELKRLKVKKWNKLINMKKLDKKLKG